MRAEHFSSILNQACLHSSRINNNLVDFPSGVIYSIERSQATLQYTNNFVILSMPKRFLTIQHTHMSGDLFLNYINSVFLKWKPNNESVN